MKRIRFGVIAISVCLAFIGCSPTTMNQGATNVSSSILTEDEYYIYENDKAIFALTDIDWFYYTNGDPFSFTNPTRYHCEGHPELIQQDDSKIYDFSDRQLSTKRGLMVGDTLRQFANSYSNIKIGLPDYHISTTPLELLKNQKEYDVDDSFTLQTSTYFLLDGTAKDKYEDVKDTDYYQYTMTIAFEYNAIVDIQIDYYSNIKSE